MVGALVVGPALPGAGRRSTLDVRGVGPRARQPQLPRRAPTRPHRRGLRRARPGRGVHGALTDRGLLAHRGAGPVREHERWSVDARRPGQRRGAGRAPRARRQHHAAPGVPHHRPRRPMAPRRVRAGGGRRRRRSARREGVEHAGHRTDRTCSDLTYTVGSRQPPTTLNTAQVDGTNAPLPAEIARLHEAARPTSQPTCATRPCDHRRRLHPLRPGCTRSSSSSSTRPRASRTRSTSTSGPTHRARTPSPSSCRAAPASACSSPAASPPWHAPPAYPRASRSATRPADSTASPTSTASRRRTRTPGARSGSRASAGPASSPPPTSDLPGGSRLPGGATA